MSHRPYKNFLWIMLLFGAASYFAYALRPKHLTADDLAIQHEVMRISNGNPVSDANTAVLQNDLRLLAFGGYVPDIPGIDTKCSNGLEVNNNEVYVMKAGPESNATKTTVEIDRLAFTGKARPYLKAYNETIVKAMSRNSPKWKKYKACIDGKLSAKHIRDGLPH